MIEAATILVADDNSDDVELLKLALDKVGLHNPVQHVSDGKQLMAYLQDESRADNGSSLPLLMLLDLNMPNATGFAILDWLRHQPLLQDLPTIIFSASSHASDIEHCFQLGAQGYWVKPSRFEDLVKLIAKLKEVLGRVVRKVESDFPLPVAA
jgi:CheY-like chemotaxis protein